MKTKEEIFDIDKEIAKRISCYKKDKNGEIKKAILRFVMSWIIFEKDALKIDNVKYNSKKTNAIVKGWFKNKDIEEINIANFDKIFSYFKNRYIEGEGNLEVLGLGNKLEFVRKALKNNENKLEASLYIAIRFRNNFLHANESKQNFENQKDNFEKASELLIRFTQAFRDLKTNIPTIKQ